MSITVIRNYLTIDHQSRAAIVVMRMVAVATVCTPFLLVSGGLTGPVPTAIVAYWVANNLWTLVQNVTIYLILHYRFPLSPEILAFQRDQRHLRIGRLRTRRAHRFKRALSLVGIVVVPWLYDDHRRRIHEANAYFHQDRAERKAEKARRKAISSERRKAKSTHLRESAERAIIEKRQRKNQSQME